MREKDAAEYCGSLSISTIRTLIAQRDFPAPVQLTKNRVAFLREDLDAWLDRRAGRAPVNAGDGSEWMESLGKT